MNPIGIKAKKSKLLQFATISFVTIISYCNHFNNSFHYDDIHSIVENNYIRSHDNIPYLFTRPYMFSCRADGAMDRSLLLVTYAINYALGGYNPAGYHLVNLLIHIGCAWLVCLLSAMLIGAGSWSLLCGLTFPIHPVQT